MSKKTIPAIGVEKMTAKCDACGKRYPVQSLEDARKYVNAPCEKCGVSPVMTEEDFDNVAMLVLLAESLAEAMPEFPADTPMGHISIRSEDGNLDFKMERQ